MIPVKKNTIKLDTNFDMKNSTKATKYLFYIRNNNKTYCEVYDESKDAVLSSIFTKEQKTNLKITAREYQDYCDGKPNKIKGHVIENLINSRIDNGAVSFALDNHSIIEFRKFDGNIEYLKFE